MIVVLATDEKERAGEGEGAVVLERVLGVGEGVLFGAVDGEDGEGFREVEGFGGELGGVAGEGEEDLGGGSGHGGGKNIIRGKRFDLLISCEIRFM